LTWRCFPKSSVSPSSGRRAQRKRPRRADGGGGALAESSERGAPLRVSYGAAIEGAVSILAPCGGELGAAIDSRWLALKLLEGDGSLLASIRDYLGRDLLKTNG
jgi:hypothetical protein